MPPKIHATSQREPGVLSMLISQRRRIPVKYWQVKMDFAEGQTVPTAEQVEAYISMAAAELGPACGDAAVLWCNEALRKAVSSAETKP